MTAPILAALLVWSVVFAIGRHYLVRPFAIPARSRQTPPIMRRLFAMDSLDQVSR